MRFYKIIILTILAFGLIACKGEEKPASPVSTLKTYTIAVKKKDATTMKLLLSEASLKIHQDEAQAQGVTLDDIVLRDTFFPPDQRVFDYRNEKIEENKATVEVKNNIGGWDIIHLVLEDGIWKIDKKATSDQMIKEVVDPSDDFEDKLEKERKEIEKSINELGTPAPNATPGTPTDPNNPNNPTDAPVSEPTQNPASSDPTPAP